MRLPYAILLSLATITGHPIEKPWKIRLYSQEENINVVLDLYEESVNVPGMDMFGPMNGYMNGNIYGTWSVTSSKILNDKTAMVGFSNDLGSETQRTTITHDTDSTWVMKFEGANVVKRLNGKKLVRIPSEITFKKSN